MSDSHELNRRSFLKQAAGAVTAAAQVHSWSAEGIAQPAPAIAPDTNPPLDLDYPRKFTGRQLRMISFPLGGVAAGSIGLGGRGQLINWEIFNRPNKGYSPSYCFPSIWVKSASSKPIARVLESRILPPYEGQDGLGSNNAPGLTRLESATFTGEYPLAHIDFEDHALPVKIELDAFSPFVPHDPDDSGLPVAILRYRVTNPGSEPAQAAIAFSIDNPISTGNSTHNSRRNQFHSEPGLAGLIMSNPGISATDPMSGEFVLAATTDAGSELSRWEGWPAGRWWNSPLLFWDQFSAQGSLGGKPPQTNAVGALCLQRTVAPRRSAAFQFLLAWRFPVRTPEWCGWDAPPGEGKTNIGNHYATRFTSAWDAASYASAHLVDLERRTRLFTTAMRESPLPAAVKDAAGANISTLATTTCFRTADGEFHGFEGSDDRSGCCFGNCAHVWNYEMTTPFLFPSFARSLRKSAFGYSMDDAGAIHFRQLLPDGKARFGYAAADGQMGQIIHAWLDWKISGDEALLQSTWPGVRKAIEFAWVPGGWDSGKRGVMDGVQHNTYDVEFYGPNPMCGIYYLGALRAAEEMARAAGDAAAADQYRSLFKQGSEWTDANLFNGEYYVQKVRGYRRDQIAGQLRGGMGADDPEHPEFQVGAGCLVDQLIGQYAADPGAIGPLVSTDKIHTTLHSIYRYNYKRSFADHDNVARTYVLNDEAAVVVCDYAKAERPRIPFPYYSEAWTGMEYLIAALMMRWGMTEEGIEIVRSARRRFDGEKRNPWDEAECGHHYARAMSAWSTLLAMSGFTYDGPRAHVVIAPPRMDSEFRCFWSTGTGWGSFKLQSNTAGAQLTLDVLSGSLNCASCELAAEARTSHAETGGRVIESKIDRNEGRIRITLAESLRLDAGNSLRIQVGS